MNIPFPPLPNFSPPSGQRRLQLWGEFGYKPAPIDGNPENIEIDRKWVADNLVLVHIPQLAGIPGAPRSCKVVFHIKAADQLIMLFKMWENDGLMDRVLTWSGSFCPRFIRGSRTSLSNHAWATAFDINVQWNMLGANPAEPGQKGCVWELVPAAHVCGFFWGGHYQNRKDGMHFECCVDLNMDNPFCI